MTTLAPVDVEAMAAAALGASTKVPKPRPAVFTTVTTGGGNKIDIARARPRLIVQDWAATSEAAFERSQANWAAVNAWAGTTVAGVWISRVELTLPVYFEDPDTKTPRYQFVAQLTTPLRRLP